MRRHALDSPISYYAIYYTVRCLPRQVCRLLGQAVGLLVYIFSQKDRLHLARNFALALNLHISHPRVKQAVRGIFRNYARYMIDFFLFPQLSKSKVRAYFSSFLGEHHLKQALAAGKGVLLVSAHIGNWEIGGNLLRALDYPLTVVGLPHNTTQTNALVHHLRKTRGIEIIEVGHSTFSVVEILNALRRNRIVAMIGDRDHLGTGRPIRFLGKQMHLPPGPVILAMMSGAALIPTFVLEQADGTYSGIIEAPLKIDKNGDRNRVIDCNLQRLADIFETYIRQYPEQWYCPDPLIDGDPPPLAC
jgi:KDO2-lipid IV(A) lauroyltransferase